jgi:tRNA(Arg) A34 adenosine deaminase TadA
MCVDNLIRLVLKLKNHFQTGQHFHCTVALKGGNIIAVGKNSYQKEHPRKRYGAYIPKRGGVETYKPRLHSEIDCLKQVEFRNDLHKITLVNIRIDNTGKLANAEPCDNCKRVLSNFKFKRIYFTIDQTKIGRFLNV